MNVYLAARFSRRDEMQHYAAELAAHGITVTSRWITGAHDASTERILSDFDLGVFAAEDLDDIAVADVVVIFTDRPSSRGGMWVEMGYAMARGLPVFVVGPVANIFCALPELVRFPDWSTARARLVRMENAA